jgi:hypothetical protein
MKNNNKLAAIYFLGAVITLAFLGLIASKITHAQEPTKTEAAKPAAAETEPPPQWMQEYEKFVQLQDVITQIKQENGIDKLETQLAKRGNVLIQQIPKGYQFDPSKRKFVALEPSPAAANPLKK